MDINAFKKINDVYGHSEGDHALQIVGQCLLDVAGSDYFAVRYGGDEFIVICNVVCEEGLDRLTEQIRNRVEKQNQKSVLPYQLSLSMGSAFLDPAADNIDSFLQRMDQRMYENKRIYYSNSQNDRRRKRQRFIIRIQPVSVNKRRYGLMDQKNITCLSRFLHKWV